MSSDLTKWMKMIEEFHLKYSREPNAIVLGRYSFRALTVELSQIVGHVIVEVDYINIIGLKLRVIKCLDDNETRVCLI